MRPKAGHPSRRLLRAVTPPPGAPWALAVQIFSSSIGTGVFAAGSAVFFTKYVGLSVSEVALGLSLPGGVAFLT